MWKQISDIKNKHQGEPLFIIGDFNSILHDTDRDQCSYRRLDMDNFRDFMIDNGLSEIPPNNFKYTWFGPDRKSSKLDRVSLLRQIGD